MSVILFMVGYDVTSYLDVDPRDPPDRDPSLNRETPTPTPKVTWDETGNYIIHPLERTWHQTGSDIIHPNTDIQWWPLKRSVHILLECILVNYDSYLVRRPDALLGYNTFIKQWRIQEGAPSTPPRTKSFLISYSFSTKLANLYAGAHLLECWRPRPAGNTGSAPVKY